MHKVVIPDWALERSVVGALKNSPQTGVIVVDNARLGKGDKRITSAYLERTVTDPEPSRVRPVHLSGRDSTFAHHEA